MPAFLDNRESLDPAVQVALQSVPGVRSAVLLVAEVDGLWELAEERGRAHADEVARVGRELAARSLRGVDSVLWEGDGRFLIVLAGVSGEDGRQVAERLCAAMRLHPFPESAAGPAHRLTLSIGAAAIPEHGPTASSVYPIANTARERLVASGGDGAALAPLPHHQALHRPLSVGRFAGRQTEFATILRWLDDAMAGTARVGAVYGESGLGTATLLRQMEAEVRLRGGAFITADSPSADVPVPFAVWRSLLRALQRLPEAPGGEWLELPILHPGSAAPELTRSGSQYRMLEELSTFVRGAARHRPLVLVLDEMQWADSTSWDALDHLLGQLRDERLLVCIASRSEREFVEVADRRAALRRHERYAEIELSRLTRDEVKQWLEATFHHQEIGREFLAFLYRHTEGNPLFLSQLLRTLLDEGALWHNGRRWEWSPVSELRLPPGLPAIISRRVARFSASTQAVLSTAATIGREFDIGLVVAAGAGSEAAVRLALSEAHAAGLLRQTFERRGGGYGFAHDRIPTAVLEVLPAEQRRVLHERVADALAARAGRAPGEVAAHYDRAGIASRAYEYAVRAADESLRIYAPVAAQGYLKLAIRNAASPSQLAEARVRLAQVAETAGRYDEVEELCDLTVEWFQGQGELGRALSLRRLREHARMEQGQPARVSLESLLALDAEAAALGADRERVAILTLASQTHRRLGEPRIAERIAGECVEMAERLDDPVLLAEALLRLANILAHESPSRADGIFARALAIYEPLGDVRGQARCHNGIGVVAQFESRLDDATRAYSVAISIARSGGMLDLWGAAALNLGVLEQKRGNYDRARELFGEAMTAFAAVKNSEYQLIALFNLAHCEREVGAWESAAELYAATTPLAQRIGQSDVEIGAVAGAGICYLELERLDRAREAGEEVEARVSSRSDWFQGREIVEALGIRLQAADGDTAGAIDRLDAALETALTVDAYSAAWLAASCAQTLLPRAPERMRALLRRLSDEVQKLGYAEMTRRYELLAAG